MSLSVETLAVARKYTDDSLAGAGAVAGVPCKIQSITAITGGNRVTFLWTDNNGDDHTSAMDVMNGVDGEDGKGIQSVSVNAQNHLIITYTDGTTVDAGQIEIHSSVDSVNGQTGAVVLDAEDVGALPDNTPIPSKTSDLTNDSGFATTSDVSTALANYTPTADLTTLLAAKQDTLTFDNAPTENSNNPVKSGGVYSAEADIFAVMGQNGAKNLIPYDIDAMKAVNVGGTWSGNEYTYNGITFAVNSDGTITVSGIASALTRLAVTIAQFENGKAYTLTGCPEGGNHVDAYTLYTQTVQNYDDGEGVTFNWSSSITSIAIAIFSGVDLTTPITFKPMLRLASDTDSTYQSYAKTNKELTDDAEALAAKVNSLKEHTGTYLAEVGTKEGSALAKIIYGMSVQDGTPTPDSPVEIQSAKADFRCVGKNLIPYPYSDGTSKTSNGITYTVNSDGSVTANGTATGESLFVLRQGGAPLNSTNNIKVHTNKNLVLSGGLSSNCGIQIALTNGTNIWANSWMDRGEGKTFSFIPSVGYYNIGIIRIVIASGQTVNNLVFKPMLTLEDADQTYEPYQHTDVTTDLTLRAIEVASTDDYNLVRDRKYYIADTIDWSEDEGYEITRRVGTFELDGTETGWMIHGDGTTSRRFDILNTSLGIPLPITTYQKSNRFIFSTTNTGEWGTFRFSFDGYLILKDNQSVISNVDTLKTWLGTNKPRFDYVLATPTTEPVTSEQAQALLSLKTYDEASYISSTGSVESSVDLEYAKSEMGAKALTGHNEAYIAQELEGVYGVKNFLDLSLGRSNLPAGITTTLTEDGGIHISGQRTDSQTSDWGLNYTIKGLKKGIAYKFTCNQYDVPRVGMYYVSSNITKPTTFTWTQDGDGTFTIYIAKGVTYDATIYPMLRLASIQSNEYQPYAKTNKELTKDVESLDAMYDGKTPSAVSDLNVPLTAGGASVAITRHLNNTTNAPTNGGGLEITWSSSDRYGAQLTLTDSGLYFRTNSSGTISAWQKIST